MKTILILASGLIVFCGNGLAFAQDKPESTPVDGKIEWVFDYEKGRQLAEKDDKPIFVVFRCER